MAAICCACPALSDKEDGEIDTATGGRFITIETGAPVAAGLVRRSNIQNVGDGLQHMGTRGWNHRPRAKVPLALTNGRAIHLND